MSPEMISTIGYLFDNLRFFNKNANNNKNIRVYNMMQFIRFDGSFEFHEIVFQ